MNPTKLITKIDLFQRRHPTFGFLYGTMKKYSEDNGGYQAALITYYGFLSLFPLLLVLVTLIQLVFGPNSSVRAKVVNSVGHYFPLLSNELQHNVHTAKGEGVGLVIGLLLTFYGARGGVNALTYALNNIWHVPQDKRGNFLSNLGRGCLILLVGGAGFIAAAFVSSFSSAAGHDLILKIIINVLGVVIIALALTYISRLAITLPPNVRLASLAYGNLVCAVLLQLLLTFGSIIMAHELKSLNAVYGTFAIVLGLLYWIYLLVQVFMYCAEANAVQYWHLWPRTLNGTPLLTADKKAHTLYAQRSSYRTTDEVAVDFKSEKTDTTQVDNH